LFFDRAGVVRNGNAVAKPVAHSVNLQGIPGRGIKSCCRRTVPRAGFAAAQDDIENQVYSVV